MARAIETICSEITETDENKRLLSDLNKMKKCLNNMFVDEKMPYYAERVGHAIELQPVARNIKVDFKFQL